MDPLYRLAYLNALERSRTLFPAPGFARMTRWPLPMSLTTPTWYSSRKNVLYSSSFPVMRRSASVTNVFFSATQTFMVSFITTVYSGAKRSKIARHSSSDRDLNVLSYALRIPANIFKSSILFSLPSDVIGLNESNVA